MADEHGIPNRRRSVAWLKPMQARFVEEYIRTANGARSAIAAGYPKETAAKTAHDLLYNSVHVRREIARHLQNFDITPQRVLEETARLAFANVYDYIEVDEDGNARVNLAGLERDEMAAIGQVTTDVRQRGNGKNAEEVRVTKLKLMDKLQALQLLGKYLKLFTDRLEIQGLEGLAEKIQQARQTQQAIATPVPPLALPPAPETKPETVPDEA